MKQGLLAFVIGFTLICCSNARPDTMLPGGVNCTDIRAQYNRWFWVGRRTINSYLKREGYTQSQINSAWKCLAT